MPTPGTQHHRIHTGYFGDNVHFLSYFQLSYYLDNKVDKIILLAVKSEGRSNEATLLLTLLLL